jgi:hypothetical protein
VPPLLAHGFRTAKPSIAGTLEAFAADLPMLGRPARCSRQCRCWFREPLRAPCAASAGG